MRGLKEKYEVHHGVDITDPAIVSAATLSHRYITDRDLPDKAIDLIDEAASRIRMEIDSKPEEMDKLDRRLIQLKIEREALKKETDEASKKRLDTLVSEIDKLAREYADLDEIWKSELERARMDMETARRAGDLARMSELQYGRIPELEKRLASAADSETSERKLLRSSVTENETPIKSPAPDAEKRLAELLRSFRQAVRRKLNALGEVDGAVPVAGIWVRREEVSRHVRRSRVRRWILLFELVLLLAALALAALYLWAALVIFFLGPQAM